LNEESGVEEEVTEEVTKTIKKKVSKEVEVDENALFPLVSAPAGFADTLTKYLAKKETFSLMVGPDLYTHPHSENCARLVALIEKYTPFSVTMIPNLSNTLGVAMICDLDGSRGSYTIGYNTAGDFTLSALGGGDLDMPSLNQQEGTLSSIDKRVNPTNSALGYGGYVLNDLANALGVNSKFTVDYTAQLPENRGFKAMAFDTLPNHFTNTGEEMRGYLLENIAVRVSGDESVTPFNADSAITDKVVYLANPVLQFSPFTAMSHQLKGSGGLYVSASAMESNGWNEGDMVRVKTARGELSVSVITDGKIEGDISYLPTFDTAINSEALFDGYRFTCVSIQKV
ncbi:MAG: ferredoxin, partial [Sulfuricurvum sp.]|nr:ferredoxin [Sulfuricurvum sp.]